jgi:ATP-dependent helicase/nuclease subunit B
VEFPFGREGCRLTLQTPAGRSVYLSGRIDRIDVAELGQELIGLVIDYKRTRDRRLDLTQVYHGLTLQLVAYLLALQQNGESLAGRPIRPVAALYLPLLEPFQLVSHPSEEKRKGVQMRGIIDLDALEAIDGSVSPGDGGSPYVNIRLNKDGQPAKTCDLAEGESLRNLMAHVGGKMGELADRMLEGDIAVQPYRLNRSTPCSWCTYRCICRHDALLERPNTLEALDRSSVFERIAGGGA